MLARTRAFGVLAFRLIPFALASTTLLAQAQVLVVDDDAATGHATIQSAVDASTTGDLILVRAGTYPNFAVVGKGLSIVADENALVVVLGTSGANQTLVRDVPAGQRALLRGLDFVPPSTVAQSTLRVADCAGLVWIEDVEVAAAAQIPFGYSLFDAEAVEIAGCAKVVLADVAIAGSPGVPPGWGLEGGQVGLSVDHSTAHLFDCNVQGGKTIVIGGLGRIGTRVEQSFVSLRGCLSRGGAGGDGIIFSSPPGNGGPGLTLGAGASVVSTDSQLLGGPGGIDVFGGTPGLAGPPFVNTGGSISQHAATNVELACTGLVRDDEQAVVHVATTPGSPVFLLVSPQPLPVFVPELHDTLGVGLAPILVPLGATSALGALDLAIGVAALPPPLLTWNVTVQVAALAGGVELVLSDPSIVTLVDDAY